MLSPQWRNPHAFPRLRGLSLSFRLAYHGTSLSFCMISITVPIFGHSLSCHGTLFDTDMGSLLPLLEALVNLFA